MGHVEVVKLLLANGANVDIKNEVSLYNTIIIRHFYGSSSRLLSPCGHIIVVIIVFVSSCIRLIFVFSYLMCIE